MPTAGAREPLTGRPRSGSAGARRRTRTLVVREHDELIGLTEDEQRDLRDFAFSIRRTDAEDRFRPVLEVRNGRLRAQNCVGVIETRRGTTIEILPKVDLTPAEDRSGRAAARRGLPNAAAGQRPDARAASDEATRCVFLTMLRDWRGLGEAQLDAAGIRDVARFDMLEAFVQLFLASVVRLARRGLARQYRTREANLACLRGRILFPRHVRVNLADRSRFYVGYDEFTANRPANRLIHLALRRLATVARRPANRQRIHQLRIAFSDAPPSARPDDDWAQHRVDRSMRHYDPVMPWVRLLLLRRGLATFAGRHVNRALLFPMEEVFEDFVTAAVRRHQRRFAVRAQGPMRPLAEECRDGERRGAFWLKPDVALLEQAAAPGTDHGMKREPVRFILDAKWKRLDSREPNHGISQSDAYQLFAYGKRYGCRQVALLYPKTAAFRAPVRYRFVDDDPAAALTLFCFPFDVADPKGGAGALVNTLMTADAPRSC